MNAASHTTRIAPATASDTDSHPGGWRLPQASRIGAALQAREAARAMQRNHSSGRPEMQQLATLIAALARLAAAEDVQYQGE